MRAAIVLLSLVIASAAFAEHETHTSGFVVWGNANEDSSNTGDEVCLPVDGEGEELYQPPQYLLHNRTCLGAFVPGSATVVACDVEIPSGYFYALCE